METVNLINIIRFLIKNKKLLNTIKKWKTSSHFVGAIRSAFYRNRLQLAATVLHWHWIRYRHFFDTEWNWLLLLVCPIGIDNWKTWRKRQQRREERFLMTVDRINGHRVIDVYVFRCRSMARYEIDTLSTTLSSLSVENVSLSSHAPPSTMPAKIIGRKSKATTNMTIQTLIILLDHNWLTTAHPKCLVLFNKTKL